MRGVFLHDYDSENFIRYVSREAREGVYRVVYFEKNFRSHIEDRKPVELIVSDATSPAKSWPNANPFLPPMSQQEQLQAYARCPMPFRHSALDEKILLYGQDQFVRKETFQPWKKHVEVLLDRISKLEEKQGLLFQAVEKLIKIIGWVRRK